MSRTASEGFGSRRAELSIFESRAKFGQPTLVCCVTIFIVSGVSPNTLDQGAMCKSDARDAFLEVAQSCRFLSRGLNSMCPQRAAVSLFSHFEGVHIGLRGIWAMCKSDFWEAFLERGCRLP